MDEVENSMNKIAIIGAGNMGSAIAASLRGDDVRVVCTAATKATLERISNEMPDVEVTSDNAEAVKDADMIVLAVKPYIAPEVIDEIRSHIRRGAVILSVVAVMPIEELRARFDGVSGNLRIIRVVPNTAIKYGKSATFIAASDDVDEETIEQTRNIFNRSGKAFVVKENQLPACTALASCGIAFFLRFIRAAVEGSVELGMKAGFATEVAALTAEGAAALLAGGAHPEAEIDKVTTPGGITIKGLNALEANGFTNAVISALRASCVK